MATEVTPLLILCLWTCVALRVIVSFQRLRAFDLTVICMALMCTFGVPSADALVDRAAGVDNLGNFFHHLAALGASASSVYAIRAIAGHPLKARRVAAVGAVTAGVLGALFAVSPIHQMPLDTRHYSDFSAQAATLVAVQVYWAIFAAFVGVSVSMVGWTALRLARSAPYRHLRWSMVCLCVTAILALTYLSQASAIVVERARGALIGAGALSPQAGTLLLALMSSCFALVFMPPPYHRRWLSLVHAYVALNRLYPLWKETAEAHPTAILHKRSRWRDLLAPRDVRFLLYRRVIEIEDGYYVADVNSPDSVRSNLRARNDHYPESASEGYAAWLDDEARSLLRDLSLRRRGKRLPIDRAS